MSERHTPSFLSSSIRIRSKVVRLYFDSLSGMKISVNFIAIAVSGLSAADITRYGPASRSERLSGLAEQRSLGMNSEAYSTRNAAKRLQTTFATESFANSSAASAAVADEYETFAILFPMRSVVVVPVSGSAEPATSR